METSPSCDGGRRVGTRKQLNPLSLRRLADLDANPWTLSVRCILSSHTSNRARAGRKLDRLRTWQSAQGSLSSRSGPRCTPPLTNSIQVIRLLYRPSLDHDLFLPCYTKFETLQPRIVVLRWLKVPTARWFRWEGIMQRTIAPDSAT